MDSLIQVLAAEVIASLVDEDAQLRSEVIQIVVDEYVMRLTEFDALDFFITNKVSLNEVAKQYMAKIGGFYHDGLIVHVLLCFYLTQRITDLLPIQEDPDQGEFSEVLKQLEPIYYVLDEESSEILKQLALHSQGQQEKEDPPLNAKQYFKPKRVVVVEDI